MIPLILSQSGTTTTQTRPVPDPGTAAVDSPTFGAVMATTDQAGDDVPTDLADGAFAAPIAADPELPASTAEPATLPALAEDAVREVEVPTPLPVKATAVDDDPTLPVPKADKSATSVREGVNLPPPVRGLVTEKQQDQDTPILREGKSTGASVAQSVVEGRLPLKGLPDAPPAQPLQSKSAKAPMADAPPPAAPLPTLDKPKSDIAGQVKDQQKPQFHLAEARPQPPREDAMPKTATPNAATTAPVHAVAAQPPAVALAQAAAQSQREVIDKALKLTDVDSILSAMPAERHISATGTSAPVAATAAPETARHASAQIAVAVTNSNGKTTEIALNPEELGRVKLSLSAGDSVITVNVLADRPETQDLLRRHIDILAQEFRQLGYTSISFSFGEQKGQARPEAMPDDQPVEPEIQETVPITRATPAPAVTGLDLRI